MDQAILVTGANGFVGRSVLEQLVRRGGPLVRGSMRHLPDRSAEHAHVELVQVAGLEPDTVWAPALTGVSCVVHCAARVHVMKETGSAEQVLTAFRQTNVQGTLQLARQAVQAGVSRFVFISSIKVNGEATAEGRPFRADDPPRPEDAYGQSKLEAETQLRELAASSGMELVIIRPPLVYGPGVKANFATMMRWLQRGIPLPLGSIHDNRRSLVALDNLADLIVNCTNHPLATGQVFLASDGEDLSTTALLQRLAQAMHRPARLLPVAPSLLKTGAHLVGRPGLAQRLIGNLQVDITATTNRLNWCPPVTVDEGLRRTIEGLHT